MEIWKFKMLYLLIKFDCLEYVCGVGWVSNCSNIKRDELFGIIEIYEC